MLPWIYGRSQYEEAFHASAELLDRYSSAVGFRVHCWLLLQLEVARQGWGSR